MITSRDKINYATKINRKKCTKYYPNTSNYELGCSHFIVRQWLVFVGCWDSLMFIIKNRIHYIGLPFGFNRSLLINNCQILVYDFKFLTFVSHETNHKTRNQFQKKQVFPLYITILQRNIEVVLGNICIVWRIIKDYNILIFNF